MYNRDDDKIMEKKAQIELKLRNYSSVTRCGAEMKNIIATLLPLKAAVNNETVNSKKYKYKIKIPAAFMDVQF